MTEPITTTEAANKIKSVRDRIVRLTEEKKALQEDIKDIYAEAKGFGLDVKTVRKMVNESLMELEKVREEQELIDLYRVALGIEV